VIALVAVRLKPLHPQILDEVKLAVVVAARLIDRLELINHLDGEARLAQLPPVAGELWDLEVPASSTLRYYDGPLYLMSLMHAAGRLQIIMPPAPAAPTKH
jgi:hypothetical protein